MGSFSWLKADDLTNIENIAYGASFKFLIPKEFGGGFIKDKYQDYGLLGKKDNGSPKYDMYELLAFWNSEMSYGLGTVKDRLYYGDDVGDEIPELPMMKEIDDHTYKNRGVGISIGYYNDEIDKLKYPLKLVSPSFKGCYEDLDKPSYSDPNQGCGSTRRKKCK